MIDGFCGAGGNTIQFAKRGCKVYANDIDKIKIEYAKHNSEIYECEPGTILFLNNDFLQLEGFENKENAVVFLSPPWGGINYKEDSEYSMISSITPNIIDIMKKARSLGSTLICFLPRNISLAELHEVLIQSGFFVEGNDTVTLELEFIVSANKIKAILLLIGDSFSKLQSEFVREYLYSIFQKIEEYQVNQLLSIIREIGLERFIIAKSNINSGPQEVLGLKEDYSRQLVKFPEIIKYLKEFEMTAEELSNFKANENKKSKSRKKQASHTEIENDKKSRIKTIYIDEPESITESILEQLLANQI